MIFFRCYETSKSYRVLISECETVKNARDIIFDEHDEENKNKTIEVLSAESSKMIHFPTEPQDNGIQINDMMVQSVNDEDIEPLIYDPI
jgi:hypothetical protein